MRNTIFLFSLIIASIFILAYCKHDATGIDQLPEVCFENQVLPIFQANCAMSGCHNGSGESFDLRSYSGIVQGVSAGDPKKSDIYNAITDKWGEMMPPKGNNQLNQDRRMLIYVWIKQGANETKCSTDTTDTIPQPSDSICFEQRILPILNSSCALSGCHNQASAEGDVILTSYSTLMNSGEQPLVSAGHANSSYIMQVIKGTGEDRMPPSPRSALTTQQIEWFTTWINDGALNSSCESGCDTTNVTFANIVFPVIQNNCIGCHSGTSPSAGVNLSNYNSIYSAASQNYLLGVIEHKTGYPLMPPSGKLSDCNIRQIQLWVDAGAPNNK